MKTRLFLSLLGLFALSVSCTSVSSEEDMCAVALEKNPLCGMCWNFMKGIP